MRRLLLGKKSPKGSTWLAKWDDFRTSDIENTFVYEEVFV